MIILGRTVINQQFIGRVGEDFEIVPQRYTTIHDPMLFNEIAAPPGAPSMPGVTTVGINLMPVDASVPTKRWEVLIASWRPLDEENNADAMNFYRGYLQAIAREDARSRGLVAP